MNEATRRSSEEFLQSLIVVGPLPSNQGSDKFTKGLLELDRVAEGAGDKANLPSTSPIAIITSSWLAPLLLELRRSRQVDPELIHLIVLRLLLRLGRRRTIELLDLVMHSGAERGGFSSAQFNAVLRAPLLRRRSQAEKPLGSVRGSGDLHAQEGRYDAPRAPSAERTEVTLSNLPVFYATRCAPLSAPTAKRRYSSERASASDLKYGVTTVTFPPNHTPGLIERPIKLLRMLGWQSDETQHVAVREIQELDSTSVRKLLSLSAGTSGREALVFVHGYKTSFNDAAMQAAGLSMDIRFPGVTALFSWPAGISYVRARNAAEEASTHFESFVRTLSQDGTFERIHLVGYSMGCYLLHSALTRVKDSSSYERVGEIILAAPDVDTSAFSGNFDFFRKVGKRRTLYASQRDLALQLTRRWNANPRAGDANPVLVLHDLETIDATFAAASVPAHGYYIENAAVRLDILNVLDGIVAGAGARRTLRRIPNTPADHWELRST